jgi:hypothetical protein
VRTRHYETDSIIAMTVAMDSAQSTNSYAASLSASAFVETGFAIDSGGIVTTYGPDAEVLLDEGFSNGYCFRLVDAGDERPRQIGLGFSPAATRRGRVDIDGALWIDTAAKALVDIEFLYRGFDRTLDRSRPGGHVEFRTMSNGITIIDRWHLRVPTRDPRATGPMLPRRTVTSSRFANMIVQETGGELAKARWRDGTTWRASLGTVRMKLSDRSGKPDSGRVVRLDSTSYVATSDASGNVVITELVPGPYAVLVVDGRLEQIGVKVPVGISFFATRDTVVSLSIVTPTPFEFAQDICRTEGTPVGTAALFGRVLNEDGSGAERVEITIDEVVSGQTLKRLAEGGHTGSDGIFRWCALERGMHIVLGTKRGNLKRTVEVPKLAAGLTVVQFALRPEP